MYKENPKATGSGIIGCFPQGKYCPLNCSECFFNSKRSYLEEGGLQPNIPSRDLYLKNVVRVNDVGDSNVEKSLVLETTAPFPYKFFNTAIPDLAFPAPVVLTINPGKLTDKDFYKIDPPSNLMFVRFRTNAWNIKLAEEAILFYVSKSIPVVLTWMAYHDEDSIPEGERYLYEFRRRTTNTYFAISKIYWHGTMAYFQRNYPLVYSCGNELHGGGCKACGNCLREFHRIRTLL